MPTTAITANFTGFPKECIRFYRNLEKNNTRTWFHEHKDEFQKYVMEPARAFVSELGSRLMTISPYIYAEPKVNRSIFRLARDTRRNKNQPPYKDRLAMLFWETHLPRLEAPALYAAISKNELQWGVGLYWMQGAVLHAYRDAVVDKKMGRELQKIAADLQKKGYTLQGKKYKRTPSGYDKNHANAEFLLHGGLYIFHSAPHPHELHSSALLDYLLEKYWAARDLHLWLVEMIRRMES